MTAERVRQHRNDVKVNTKRLVIQFGEKKNIKVKRAVYDHKDVHKEIWTSPDRKNLNYIDHRLRENKHHQYVKDARSYRRAGAESDHALIRAQLNPGTINRDKNKRLNSQIYNTETRG